MANFQDLNKQIALNNYIKLTKLIKKQMIKNDWIIYKLKTKR